LSAVTGIAPIIASRVTRAANSSSPHSAVPSGRFGKTRSHPDFDLFQNDGAAFGQDRARLGHPGLPKPAFVFIEVLPRPFISRRW
jgi:hypothetical protein